MVAIGARGSKLTIDFWFIFPDMLYRSYKYFQLMFLVYKLLKVNSILFYMSYKQ